MHQVLYLIFNEGYSSSKGETAIRADLCEEAARLCHLLCSHQRCSTPPTRALMALMLFHAARLDARLDDRGCVLLMEDQDRDQVGPPADPARQGVPRPVGRGRPSSPRFIWRRASPSIIARPRAMPKPIGRRSCASTTPCSRFIARRSTCSTGPSSSPRSKARKRASARWTKRGQNPALRHYHLFDATLGEFYRARVI